MTGADGPRGRGSTPTSVPVGRRWRSPFPRVETSTRPTPQHRRMSVPTLLQSWQEGYPHELEHRVEPRSARPSFNLPTTPWFGRQRPRYALTTQPLLRLL